MSLGQRPFAGPKQVLSYLSQYTHRVAISERRIEAFDPAAHTVTFRWRDYAEGSAVKRETLPVDDGARQRVEGHTAGVGRSAAQEWR